MNELQLFLNIILAHSGETIIDKKEDSIEIRILELNEVVQIKYIGGGQFSYAHYIFDFQSSGGFKQEHIGNYGVIEYALQYHFHDHN